MSARIILLNNTASGITLVDVSNTYIPISTPFEITDTYPVSVVADSEYLKEQIITGDVSVSDGTEYFSITEATAYLDSINTIAQDVHIADDLRDPSGKLRVHQTSRKLGTKIHFTGEGDDTSNVMAVGGGTPVVHTHTIGDNASEVIYVDLNIVENETWVHEGYLTWKDAYLDTVTLDIVPRTVSVVAASNTQYDVYGGYLIVPNPYMQGSVDVTSDITTHSGGLVYIPIDEDGTRSSAFWNADWNTTTKEYENITMAPLGDGEYNMFSYEITMARFINRIPLLDSGFIALNSSDTDELGQGMRIRMTFDTNTTNGPDHGWAMAATICFHRERST